MHGIKPHKSIHENKMAEYFGDFTEGFRMRSDLSKREKAEDPKIFRLLQVLTAMAFIRLRETD
jgi:hypothetical protein